jgi:hypothetical protein
MRTPDNNARSVPQEVSGRSAGGPRTHIILFVILFRHKK